jgi:hypothetical protein
MNSRGSCEGYRDTHADCLGGRHHEQNTTSLDSVAILHRTSLSRELNFAPVFANGFLRSATARFPLHLISSRVTLPRQPTNKCLFPSRQFIEYVHSVALQLWQTLAGWAAAAGSLSRLHQTVLGWHVVSTSNPTAAFSAFLTGPLLLYSSNYSVYPITRLAYT